MSSYRGKITCPFAGDQGAIIDEIEEFLTGVRYKPETERVLTTVLFARIANSPQRVAGQSAERWRDLLRRFRAQVGREIAWSRGREIDMTGEGVLAIFDGPARPIRCACAISEYALRLGIEVRAGLHTGECELLDGNLVGGLTVEIGRRIRERARAGEVLVSHTVKDLVAGSGLSFEEHGAEVFDPLPGQWRLYKVVRQI